MLVCIAPIANTWARFWAALERHAELCGARTPPPRLLHAAAAASVRPSFANPPPLTPRSRPGTPPTMGGVVSEEEAEEEEEEEAEETARRRRSLPESTPAASDEPAAASELSATAESLFALAAILARDGVVDASALYAHALPRRAARRRFVAATEARLAAARRVGVVSLVSGASGASDETTDPASIAATPADGSWEAMPKSRAAASRSGTRRRARASTRGSSRRWRRPRGGPDG